MTQESEHMNLLSARGFEQPTSVVNSMITPEVHQDVFMFADFMRQASLKVAGSDSLQDIQNRREQLREIRELQARRAARFALRQVTDVASPADLPGTFIDDLDDDEDDVVDDIEAFVSSTSTSVTRSEARDEDEDEEDIDESLFVADLAQDDNKTDRDVSADTHIAHEQYLERIDSLDPHETQVGHETVKRLMRGVNVLSDKVRNQVIRAYFAAPEAVRYVMPSRKSLLKAGVFLYLFTAAYELGSGVQNIGRNSKDDAPARAVESDTTALSLTELSTPTSEVIEVTTTAVAEEIPAPETTEKPIETTTSTTEAHEPEVISIFEQIETGERSLRDFAGMYIGNLIIPRLCLDDAQLYGSNKGSFDDATLLDALQQNNLLTDAERAVYQTGKGSKRLNADIQSRYDPIFYLQADDGVSEAPCTTDLSIGKYGSRFEAIPRGSSAALAAAGEGHKVGDFQPIVDIDWQGVAPGQTGNIVISGHRTTESAPLMNIDLLTIGDTISLADENGTTYTYIIEATEVIQPTVTGYDQILHYESPSGNQETLTLYTCDTQGAVRDVIRAVRQK